MEDVIKLSLKLPDKVDRLRNLAFLLGLLGVCALFFPDTYRTDTGKSELETSGVEALTVTTDEDLVFWDKAGGTRFTVSRLSQLQELNSPETIEELGQLQFVQPRWLDVRSEPSFREGEVSARLYRYMQVDIKNTLQQELYPGGPKQEWLQVEYEGPDGELKSGYVVANSIGPQALNLNAGRLFLHPASVDDLSTIYEYHWLSIMAAPFKLLSVFAVVWILYAVALFMAPTYLIATYVVMLLNFVYAFVTERNNEQLVRFMVRADYFRWKLLVSISGVSTTIPHADIYATERISLPISYEARYAADLSRASILVRIGIAFGYLATASFVTTLATALFGELAGSISLIVFMTPAFVLGALAGLYAILQVLAWAIAGITGRPAGAILKLMFRIQRFFTALNALVCGWTGDPSLLIKSLQSSGVIEGEQDGDASEGYYNPSSAIGLEVNLLILFVLILLSNNLYLLFWLGRVIKLMGDDAFTLLVLMVLSSSLLGLFLFPNYYRKAVSLRKRDPSILVELLTMVPIVNLLLAPFIIQYELNVYSRLREKQAS